MPCGNIMLSISVKYIHAYDTMSVAEQLKFKKK